MELVTKIKKSRTGQEIIAWLILLSVIGTTVALTNVLAEPIAIVCADTDDE